MHLLMKKLIKATAAASTPFFTLCRVIFLPLKANDSTKKPFLHLFFSTHDNKKMFVCDKNKSVSMSSVIESRVRCACVTRADFDLQSIFSSIFAFS